MALRFYSLSIPEYHVRTKPDAKAIGRKIDDALRKHFLNRKVAIRCIGSQEHKGKSLNELVRVIKKMGTDRYDPRRQGDRYDNLRRRHIDLFALESHLTRNSRIMEKFIEPFYEWPKQSRGKPVRVDLVMLYDRSQLKRVSHTYDGKRIKRDGFIFKNPQQKAKALVGLVMIR